MTPAQTIIARHMSEAELMANVVECAQRLGWRVAHINDGLYRLAAASGRADVMSGARGLPDLILARDGVVVFAELKTERGRLSGSQRDWRLALLPSRLPSTHHVYVWRPSDWLDGVIECVLRGVT